MMNLQTRTELLLIADGWLWAFALAAINNPKGASRMAIAAAIALLMSLLFRRAVMRFFQADLSQLGERLATTYLWAIAALVLGVVLSGYALVIALLGPL
jgi:hypothetical protein